MGYNIWKVFSTKTKDKKFNRPEVVGCSAYVPYNIFIKIFFESQGYGIQDNVLYQDNQNEIRMKKTEGALAPVIQDTLVYIIFLKERVDKKE